MFDFSLCKCSRIHEKFFSLIFNFLINYERIYIVIVTLFAYILDCCVSALLCNYLYLDSRHKRNYATCPPGKDPLIFLKKLWCKLILFPYF